MLEDWLLEQEDPRGDIIPLEKTGQDEAAVAARTALHRDLLGDDHERLAPLLFRANWRAGYVRECNFAGGLPEAFAAFCRAPAAALLRGLTLTVAKAQVEPMLRAIADSVFAETLHELTISNVHVSPPLVSADTLATLARLRRLALRGAYPLAPATISRIAHLLVAPTTYDVANLASFSATSFPDVTDFVLDYTNMANPHLEPEVLAAMFETAFPRLERFELRAADDDLAARVRREAAKHPRVSVR